MQTKEGNKMKKYIVPTLNIEVYNSEDIMSLSVNESKAEFVIKNTLDDGFWG